jgi:AcrR family transcriptional regulator
MAEDSTLIRPHGPAQVRAAAVAAATELFAERPPGAVTVRQIAERAGVNHALVHRYIGTKEDLLREVLEHNARTAERLNAELVGGADLERIVAFALENPGYLRAFLAVRLAGEWETELLPQAQPLMQRLVAELAAEQRERGIDVPELSAPMAVAAIAALLSAWCAAGPFLAGRADAPAGTDERAELTAAVQAIWDRALAER